MIVIEPYGEQLPDRPRYPGKIQLPVLIPPSPEGTDRPLAPQKSKLWLWALAAGVVGLVYTGKKPSPKRRKKPSSSARKLSGASVGYFITPEERKRGQKLLYLWKAKGVPGKPKVISKRNLVSYKEGSGTRGDLFPVWAYTADHARELIRAGAVEPYRIGTTDPEQLALFGYLRDLEGRIANCAIWIPDGRGGYKCGMYGRVCDSPTCETSPDPLGKQTKICAKTQKIFSSFYNKLITRCKRYEPTCEGPACMDFTMPYPTEKSQRTTPTDEEVKGYAEWMADQYNEEHFGKTPYLAREILDRGGISPPRTPAGLEKPKRQQQEYTMIPLFLRNKRGLPCDEMANEMGYDYCDDLREDILKAYPPKEKGAWKKIQRKTWRDFQEDAKWEIEEKMYAGEWSGLLSGAPARVWKTTLEEFTALQRDKKDPALPNELNWILTKTKVNPEGILRVFRGDLPGHMQHRLRDWLRDRYQHPDWLPDKRVKLTFRSGRKESAYIIEHPFYTVVVKFYETGTVQVTEDRGNYHGRSVEQALIQGKPVPKKVLENYAPYIPLAKQALSLGDLGQELFPGLRRELVMEEPEDVATSDDAVTACMERLGWKINRMEELKASIAEKMIPDLFTGKMIKLSAPEKEYQRVVGQCLKKSRGIAGVLGLALGQELWQMTREEAEREQRELNKKAIQIMKATAEKFPETSAARDIPKKGRTLSHDLAPRYLPKEDGLRYKQLMYFFHKGAVQDAISEGKQIPESVRESVGLEPEKKEPEQLQLLGRRA